jgi:hypothetical protein
MKKDFYKSIKDGSVVEAYIYTTDKERFLKEWSNGKIYASPVLEPTEDNPRGYYVQIETKNGIITAIPCDYIAKINGDFVVYSPNTFLEETTGISREEVVINKIENNGGCRKCKEMAKLLLKIQNYISLNNVELTTAEQSYIDRIDNVLEV